MASPTAFTRQTSFTQFSSNYPSRQQNGASLDAEFNAAKVALDETQSNLALIQDDDGALARGSVGRGQLDSSLTIGFESPTPWAADTAYEADTSTVWYTGKFYTALEDHTSAETFDADKWFEVADLSASAAIEDGSITEAKLASSAVTADKIQALAVTTPKIASSAVTTAKIADNAVTIDKVDSTSGPDLASLILPAGLGPIPWPSDTAPTGWVFDGATYSRATYPALSAFALAEAALGNTWFTVGDGSTTFGIASGAGYTLAGKDAAGSVIGSALALGGAVGAATHTLTTAEMPIHNHVVLLTDPGHDHGVSGGTSGSTSTIAAAGGADFVAGNNPAAIDITPATTGVYVNGENGVNRSYSEGGGGAHTIVQPTKGVRFIFKAH